ncbi:hypothetical protein EGT74_24600 [Chitinophaga lutea]|uniref:Uncharacterized protein n=1 Tax=Chitinophaga lutea TaxID=2488634 RepID=A0A3N4PBF5_9BACT|nr:hypothetical protein [Chitinophaga lutea]RPE05566.1 hypothetical protein EGT74_24600 [Chitinophaga lutea]
MKFLTQTKFYDPTAGVRGNCMMACYASFFDLELSQVPAIEELFDDESVSWYERLVNWLNSLGYDEERNHFKQGRPVDPAESGYKDYYFAVGPASRGVHHMVIYRHGKLVHDPHPSREGLLQVDGFITLKKLTQ